MCDITTIVSEEIITRLFDYSRKIIKEMNNTNSLKNCFVESGKSMSLLNEKEHEFFCNVETIFSKENMKKLENKSNEISSRYLIEYVQNEIKSLLAYYQVSYEESETLTYHFINTFLNIIEKKNPQLATQIYLADLKQYVSYKYECILKPISEIQDLIKSDVFKKNDIQTVEEINYEIQYFSKPQISLDFFEIDDSDFIESFNNQIHQNRIDVVGHFIEETVYCVLNQLVKMNLSKDIYVIKSSEAWRNFNKLNKDNCILIPFFKSNEINAIPNNTNVFIWSYFESCNANKSIKLRRRTMTTIKSKLREAGMPENEISRICEKTHGLYFAMKRFIYNGKYRLNRNFDNVTDENILYAALLSGNWTDKDTRIIEDLSYTNYSTFSDKLVPLISNDEPLFYIINDYGKKSYTIIDSEEIWNKRVIDGIPTTIWKKFISNLYDIYLGEYSLKASYALKLGMLKTLLTIKYGTEDDEKYHIDIHNEIIKLIKKINTYDDYDHIKELTDYFFELQPDAYLSKIEKDFKNKKGLFELDNQNSSTNLLFCTYYISPLTKLLFVNKYKYRVLDLLWKIYDQHFSESIDGYCRQTLESIYCAGANICCLDTNDKIRTAQKYINKSDSAWDLLYSEFPHNRSVAFALSEPTYLQIDEVAPLTNLDVYNTYISYLDLCCKYINQSVDRCIKLLDTLTYFEEKIIHDKLLQLEKLYGEMDDYSLILIKNKIREIIYKNRFYANADWALDEETLRIYETHMQKISTVKKEYEYIYLFVSDYHFPLLHPARYELDQNYDEINQSEMEKEIKDKLYEFKTLNLNLALLIKMISKSEDMTTLGTNIAKYYVGENIDFDIAKTILENDQSSQLRELMNYLLYYVHSGDKTIDEMINFLKTNEVNDNLIVRLLDFCDLSKETASILAKQNIDVQKAFWSRNELYSMKNYPNHFHWIFKQCLTYGNLYSCISLIHLFLDKLDKHAIFDCLKSIVKIFDIYEMYEYHASFEYYVQCILNKLYEKNSTDFLNEEIAKFEFKCRDFLEWRYMKSVRHIFENSPIEYAKFITSVFSEEPKNNYLNNGYSLYSFFRKAKFCPANNNENVDLEKLKIWIGQFKNFLVKENKGDLVENILGKLFSNSPIGRDGYMPCESIRNIIETMDSDSLNNSYAIEIFNSRGIYTCSSGEGEKKLAYQYKENADGIRIDYPITASIYDRLYENYMMDSKYERECSENGYY